MSNFFGNVHQGLRISPRAVQKWILLPTGEITEWDASGFQIGDRDSDLDAIYVAGDIQMLFNGECKLEVCVRDEHDQPVAGVKVDHGWPSIKWPEFDDAVMRVTDAEGKVEWVIFSEFDPMTDIGPLWVMLHGYHVSDVVMGFGIPTTHQYKALVTYRVTFRKIAIRSEVKA
jgi:hypothetical protein